MLDETKNQPYIETVQGSGYRFVAPVHEASQGDWEKNSAQAALSAQENTSREWTFDSIAVLPLHNENGDTEIDYLADGLTESFINSLSRLQNLKVIARNTVFRYKNKNADPKQVGETLGVATVLTGRIRIIKDLLIISIELTKTGDGTQIWGTSFNRSFTDIIEIQQSIICEVLEQLKSEINNISKQFLTNQITRNPESYRLYLKGKYLQEKGIQENFYKAIECFEKSVSFDPTNVYSYVETIQCYVSLFTCDYISHELTLKKIKPYLIIVSELNQTVDVVQALYGTIKMYLEFNIKDAEKHLQYALTINPNCLSARYRYADLLINSGRFSEAIIEINKIVRTDPLSLLPNYRRLGRLFYKMGQLEIANKYLFEALEMNPDDYISLTISGGVLTQLGDYNKALDMFEKSLGSQFNIETLSMIGYVNAILGRKEKASQIIEQILSESKIIHQCSLKIAVIYLALKEKELAYKFLEKSFHEHECDLLAIKYDSRLKEIIDEPRLKSLILKIGLTTD